MKYLIFSILVSTTLIGYGQILDISEEYSSESQMYLLPDSSYCENTHFERAKQISLMQPRNGCYGVIYLKDKAFVSKLNKFENVEALTLICGKLNERISRESIKQIKCLKKLKSIKILGLESKDYGFLKEILANVTGLKVLELDFRHSDSPITFFPIENCKINTSLLKLIIHVDTSFTIHKNIQLFKTVKKVIVYSEDYKPVEGLVYISGIEQLSKFHLVHYIKVVYEEFPVDVTTKIEFKFTFSESSICFKNIPFGVGKFVFDPEKGSYSGYSYLPIDCSSLQSLSNCRFLDDSASANLVLKNVKGNLDVSTVRLHHHIKYLSIDNINIDSSLLDKFVSEVKVLDSMDYLYLGFSVINPNVYTLSELSKLMNLNIQFTITKEYFDIEELKDKFPFSTITVNEIKDSSVFIVNISPLGH